MSKIKYVEVPKRHEIRVFVDNKRTGTIVAMRNAVGGLCGYQYRIKGSTHLHRGNTFATVAECKASLEAT